jgi:hypothetical protein
MESNLLSPAASPFKSMTNGARHERDQRTEAINLLICVAFLLLRGENLDRGTKLPIPTSSSSPQSGDPLMAAPPLLFPMAAAPPKPLIPHAGTPRRRRLVGWSRSGEQKEASRAAARQGQQIQPNASIFLSCLVVPVRLHPLARPPEFPVTDETTQGWKGARAPRLVASIGRSRAKDDHAGGGCCVKHREAMIVAGRGCRSVKAAVTTMARLEDFPLFFAFLGKRQDADLLARCALVPNLLTASSLLHGQGSSVLDFPGVGMRWCLAYPPRSTSSFLAHSRAAAKAERKSGGWTA